MSVHLHSERSGGVSKAILDDPRVNTGEYQGRGVSMSEMVQLDRRCFGHFRYASESVRDGVGISGSAEVVREYQTLIPVSAAESQNVFGLPGPVMA